MRRLFIIFIIALSMSILFGPVSCYASESAAAHFSDVPRGSWADRLIHEAREIGLTEGKGNNVFGYGEKVKRCEFVKFLVSLMGWEILQPETGSFEDNRDKGKWYYSYIETAAVNKAILKDNVKFRPEEDITREEMALMIVRSLGYDSLGKQLSYMGKPFSDVERNEGYITIVKDLGIVTGKPMNKFDPGGSATREEAVAMLMRMHEKLTQPLNELHAFYAIESYPQIGFIDNLNSVSFGWSRVEYDAVSGRVFLNTVRKDGNVYGVPEAFSEPVQRAQSLGLPAQLMVTLEEEQIPGEDGAGTVSLPEYILTRPEPRNQIIGDIVRQVLSTERDGIAVKFDGIVIDFECLNGEVLKRGLNEFLFELRSEMDKNNIKNLYVAVHPKRRDGLSYYDGYDFKTIGSIADRVILMAHDYNAKKMTEAEMSSGWTDTPLTPFDEVYYALKTITDKDTGVSDLNRVWLQISFDWVMWKIKDGKVLNQYPLSLGLAPFRQILAQGALINYSEFSNNPYVKYNDTAEGVEKIIWYEDSRSVLSKIQLAKLFGINGVSLWRLGNIPADDTESGRKAYQDIWQSILEKR